MKPSRTVSRTAISRRLIVCLATLGFVFVATSGLADDADSPRTPLILKPAADGTAPSEQMHALFLREAEATLNKWNAEFAQRLAEPGALAAREQALRRKLIAAIGGLPERTPLNARVTGTLHGDGYRIEKVIFESQPGFAVTGSLYLPDAGQYSPPYPGVLVPCGHYEDSKAHDEYQSMGALLALNGMAALVYDPIDQGERLQSAERAGRERYWGTRAHTLDDIQTLPLGQSIARYFIWDGMRGLDYLQSRQEIDPARLGITGNSGGGTQAAQIFALDDRIKVAAISCYLGNYAAQIRQSMGDGEQNIPGALARGLDHPDLILMRAPAPFMLLTATHDFFDPQAAWATYRIINRAYTAQNASANLSILENDAGHNYNRVQREGATAWLARWLRGHDAPVNEPPLKLFSEADLQSTPDGSVLRLPGARSLRDLRRAAADQAANERRARWSALSADGQRDEVRRLAGFSRMSEIPAATWTEQWSRKGAANSRLKAERMNTAGGALDLPALWIESAHASDQPPCLFLSGRGLHDAMRPGGRLAALAESGRRVLAIDVRGTGETGQRHQRGMPPSVGGDWEDIYAAILLGKSYVGLQAEDVLAAVGELRRRAGGAAVDLVAVGDVGVAALHAAFAEPGQFHSVRIARMPVSWDAMVRADRSYGQFRTVVPGALRVYDLPDLVAGLGAKITVTDPLSALGLPLTETQPAPADLLPTQPGLVGVYYGSTTFQKPLAVEELSTGEMVWHKQRDHRRGSWSATWSGALVPAVSAEVEVGLETTEDAVLLIDGREMVKASGGFSPAGMTLRLENGKPLPCEIRFVQPSRDHRAPDYRSTLKLIWRTPDGDWQPVPDEWLRHTREQRSEAERGLRE